LYSSFSLLFWSWVCGRGDTILDKRDEGLVMGVGFWKTRNWEEEEEDECEM